MRRWRSTLLRHVVAMVGVVGVFAQIALYGSRPTIAPIRSDGYSYYVYLPNWLLFHDPTLQAAADDCCGGEYPAFAAIIRWPGTGRWVNAHPIGVAVMTAPFFGVAHGLTRWSNLPPDGFSLYYQHAVALAGLAYVLAGLAILRRLLRRHFTEGVVLATLVAITFGTNLFHYAVYDASYSHAFAFCLVCSLLALTDRWWREPGWRVSAALGAVAGLIVLVRHPNALFLALIPLAGVTGWREIVPHARRLLDRWPQLIVIALVAALCVLPQLVLYRQATGSWLVSSYGNLGFPYLWSPRIADVLVSVQKGLFFWSPILLLAVAGFLVPTPWSRRWRLPAAAVFTLLTYIIASWHDWQFGAASATGGTPTAWASWRRSSRRSSRGPRGAGGRERASPPRPGCW
jgi:hypothetical protein